MKVLRFALISLLILLFTFIAFELLNDESSGHSVNSSISHSLRNNYNYTVKTFNSIHSI